MDPYVSLSLAIGCSHPEGHFPQPGQFPLHNGQPPEFPAAGGWVYPLEREYGGAPQYPTLARVWLLARGFIWLHHFLKYPLLMTKRSYRLAFLSFHLTSVYFWEERGSGKRGWLFPHATSSHGKFSKADPPPLRPWHPTSPFLLYGSPCMRA